MTSRAAKCARLLRVRAVEHRIAMLRLDGAETKLRNLLDVSMRAAALRTSLAIEPGASNGWQIQGAGALSARLGSATASLNVAIQAAQEVKHSTAAARNVARRIEDHITRMRAAAGDHDATVMEKRRAAALPTSRKPKTRLAE